MGSEFLHLRLVPSFRVREMVCEFFDLRFVVSFGLGQMGSEFLDLRLVTRFRLGEKLTVEMLDLRQFFLERRHSPG